MKFIAKYLAIGILIGMGFMGVDWIYQTIMENQRGKSFTKPLSSLFNDGERPIPPKFVSHINLDVFGNNVELDTSCKLYVLDNVRVICLDAPAYTSMEFVPHTQLAEAFQTLSTAAGDDSTASSSIGEFRLTTFEIDFNELNEKANSMPRDESKQQGTEISSSIEHRIFTRYICKDKQCVRINTKSKTVLEGISFQVIGDV